MSADTISQSATTSATTQMASLSTSSLSSVSSPPLLRPRTLSERQPYIFAYGAAISLVSPAATAYQLCKLYKFTSVSSMQLLRMSLVIFPHQTVLKALQMNASTPVKEYCNPWAAFAVVGILQGGVYGQANTHFARVLGINSSSATTTATSSSAINNNTNTTVTAVKRMFRGSAFAGGRDMISQGLPFMCSGLVRSVVLDPLFPTIDSNMTHANQDQFGGSDNNNDKMIASIKHWTALLTTSIVATYLSQGLHNLQITMQADPTLSYARVVPTVFQQHGFSMLYKGAEARVGLLLIVNVLNELLLKPAWTSIPV